MSGGFPEAKPWASCCPRSEATITFTSMPVCFVNAFAAPLTAKVSAGPELPISAVSVVAWLFVGEPRAAPTATASALTVTTANKNQRRLRVVRCGCKRCGCMKCPPWRAVENEKRARRTRCQSGSVGKIVGLSPSFEPRLWKRAHHDHVELFRCRCASCADRSRLEGEVRRISSFAWRTSNSRSRPPPSSCGSLGEYTA